MSYSVVKVSHKSFNHEYAVRLKMDTGEVMTKRLGFHPSADTFDFEPQELKNEVHLKILNVIKNLNENNISRQT